MSEGDEKASEARDGMFANSSGAFVRGTPSRAFSLLRSRTTTRCNARALSMARGLFASVAQSWHVHGIPDEFDNSFTMGSFQRRSCRFALVFCASQFALENVRGLSLPKPTRLICVCCPNFRHTSALQYSENDTPNYQALFLHTPLLQSHTRCGAPSRDSPPLSLALFDARDDGLRQA